VVVAIPLVLAVLVQIVRTAPKQTVTQAAVPTKAILFHVQVTHVAMHLKVLAV
jgi:hypothetical protein